MELTALFTYMMTLAALTLAPGPLVAVLVARSASRDRRGACAIAIGICAGDILVILTICAGLGFWLQAHPEVFTFAKYAGVGFLLWMAVRMWLQSEVSMDPSLPVVGSAASFLTGFAICLSSPQTVVMYAVLLPRVADLTMVRLQDAIFLIFATISALFGVFLLIILLAETMQRALHSSNVARLWARGMSLTVALSAIWIFVA
ncbi:LysE family translocator [Halomonas cerina]|uniref:Threonine/homoserine/homoserine lactone efflux protein n=1 Tax=Halomonas cerina TaxID=447424 RepID=A0A839V812_9GAMM|nr:LysE family translocator [Halomonas cerina]MBB3189995.1 threonine/homoserine/homoserine lactone efflux protein [Halomonas cerina]